MLPIEIEEVKEKARAMANDLEQARVFVHELPFEIIYNDLEVRCKELLKFKEEFTVLANNVIGGGLIQLDNEWKEQEERSKENMKGNNQ